MHFWQELYISDVVSSVHHIRRHMMSVYPIIGDVNFDHLVKMVSARFLYPNNVNISFFRVNK